MSIYLSILILTISLSISIIIYKDIMSPAILVKIPWLISLLFLLFTDFDYDSNSFLYLYFVVGLIAFDIGHLLFSMGKKRPKWTILSENRINHKLIKIIMALEIIVILSYMLSVIYFIRGNFVYNFYYTIKLGSVNGSFQGSFLMGYFINFVIAFTALIIYIFVSSDNLKKNTLILQIILGFISVLLTLGRTSVVLFVIFNLSIFVIIRNLRNQKIIKYFLLLLTIGAVFFGWYNLLKYPYKIGDQGILNVAFEGIVVYLSGGLVAFEKWASGGIEYIYGLNMFRFFIAILNKIGYEFNLMSLVNPYINIGDGKVTNVYTIYYFYVLDFGLIFGLFIQMIFGSIHGFLYRTIRYNKPIWVYFFSLSLYPLMMQFFQDQYISLTSTWIQLSVYGLIFFKTNIFIKKDSEEV